MKVLSDIEEESVRQQFSVCGTITNVRVIRDRTTGAGKGFGYVTFMVTLRHSEIHHFLSVLLLLLNDTTTL